MKNSTHTTGLRKITEGMAGIAKSSRYKRVFGSDRSSRFIGVFRLQPNVKAASTIQSLNPSQEAILRALLGATNASTWSYIQKAQNSDFVPEVMMPAERTFSNN